MKVIDGTQYDVLKFALANSITNNAEWNKDNAANMAIDN